MNKINNNQSKFMRDMLTLGELVQIKSKLINRLEKSSEQMFTHAENNII